MVARGGLDVMSVSSTTLIISESALRTQSVGTWVLVDGARHVARFHVSIIERITLNFVSFAHAPRCNVLHVAAREGFVVLKRLGVTKRRRRVGNCGSVQCISRRSIA